MHLLEVFEGKPGCRLALLFQVYQVIIQTNGSISELASGLWTLQTCACLSQTAPPQYHVQHHCTPLHALGSDTHNISLKVISEQLIHLLFQTVKSFTLL